MKLLGNFFAFVTMTFGLGKNDLIVDRATLQPNKLPPTLLIDYSKKIRPRLLEISDELHMTSRYDTWGWRKQENKCVGWKPWYAMLFEYVVHRTWPQHTHTSHMYFENQIKMKFPPPPLPLIPNPPPAYSEESIDWLDLWFKLRMSWFAVCGQRYQNI